MTKIITICSSMQFRAEIQNAAKLLEQQGFKVFTPDLSERIQSDIEHLAENQLKRSYIKNHFAKISQSDAILVLNYPKKGIDGYIGSNTLMEIGVAFNMNKKIYLLFDPGEQGSKEEVMSLVTKILQGKLDLLIAT